MFFSIKNRGQSLATLAVFMTAILTGCGGGGGSGGGVTPPPPVNAVISVSVTPFDGATNVARDSKVVMTYSVTSGTYTSTTGTLSCDGTSFVLAQTTDLATRKVTFSPSTALPYGSTCIAQGVATASGQDGGSQANISWKSTFTVLPLTCPSGQEVKNGVCVPVVTTWWPPAFVPMGTKVYLDSATAPSGAVTNATFPGQTQSGLLPTACKITGDDCWKEAVRNGTIKFISTTATDQTNRPIVFGVYKTVSTVVFPGQNKTLYCNKPFFSDDGSLVATNDPVENRCLTDEGIYFIGNILGGITQVKRDGSGLIACFQWQFNPNLLGWSMSEAVCQ